MTVSSTTNKALHTGDGSTVSFSYTYRADNDSDITVYLDEVLQASGWSVTREPDNIGGTVTFDTAPVVDVIITILRELVLDQNTDYTPYDAFPADAHENALDKLTMISQQQQEEIDRNTQAIGSGDDVDTQSPPYDAGKGWMWSESGDKRIINSDDNINGITAAAQQSADDAANSAIEASGSVDNARLEAWNAEAEALTSYSYAVQPEDVFVNIYSSNGDGSFTATPTSDYSSLHWAAKALDGAAEGESNTTSNLGSGTGLATPKNGVNLPFKSLLGANDIVLTNDVDTITISSDPTILKDVDIEVTVARYYTDAPDWAGIVLTGTDLTAVNILGANPEARLYPDGSIVGSSDYGKFTKNPNGDLHCWEMVVPNIDVDVVVGNIFKSPVVTVPYPIAMIDLTYSAYCDDNTTVNTWGAVATTETDSCLGTLFSYQVFAARVMTMVADGRWKV